MSDAHDDRLRDLAEEVARHCLDTSDPTVTSDWSLAQLLQEVALAAAYHERRRAVACIEATREWLAQPDTKAVSPVRVLDVAATCVEGFCEPREALSRLQEQEKTRQAWEKKHGRQG